MRRIFDSPSFLLVCILAASPSSIISASTSANDQGITTYSVQRSRQSDGLDRILTSIPTRNPWARWGMEWARWGKDFARMWPLCIDSSYCPQRYSQQSPNGGMYSPESWYGEPPYGRQPFNGPYSGNGRERYPFGRRPPSPSYYNRNQAAAYDRPLPGRTAGYEPYYGNRSPRALTAPYQDSDDIRSSWESPLYDTVELDEQMRQFDETVGDGTRTSKSKTEARS